MIALAMMLFTMLCFGVAFAVLVLIATGLEDWANARDRRHQAGERTCPLWLVAFNILVGILGIGIGLLAAFVAIANSLVG